MGLKKVELRLPEGSTRSYCFCQSSQNLQRCFLGGSLGHLVVWLCWVISFCCIGQHVMRWLPGPFLCIIHTAVCFLCEVLPCLNFLLLPAVPFVRFHMVMMPCWTMFILKYYMLGTASLSVPALVGLFLRQVHATSYSAVPI